MMYYTIRNIYQDFGGKREFKFFKYKDNIVFTAIVNDGRFKIGYNEFWSFKNYVVAQAINRKKYRKFLSNGIY